jgi:hypothetical protein
MFLFQLLLNIDIFLSKSFEIKYEIAEKIFRVCAIFSHTHSPSSLSLSLSFYGIDAHSVKTPGN